MNFKKWLENSMQALVPALPDDEDHPGGEVPNAVNLDIARDPATGKPVKLRSKFADNLFVHRIKKQRKA